jgi:hypothetical protein
MKLKTGNIRRRISGGRVVLCACLSSDSIVGTGEIMVFAPITLRELCIALDLSSPGTCKNEYTLSLSTHTRTFFLEQVSHALRLGLRGPRCDSGECLLCARLPGIGHETRKAST